MHSKYSIYLNMNPHVIYSIHLQYINLQYIMHIYIYIYVYIIYVNIVQVYIYIYTLAQTHTHIYIYIHIVLDHIMAYDITRTLSS